MKLKDYKYLFAFLLPYSAFISVYHGGIWAFTTVIFSFVVLPVSELFLKVEEENVLPEEELGRAAAKFFDLLLYLNLPILYGLIFLCIHRIINTPVDYSEVVGMVLAVGVTAGAAGINVAHELGHRKKSYERWISRLLLTANLYTHFYIEHNRGHHLHVGTPEDPASAARGQNFYAFLVRSIIGGLMGSFKLEQTRLSRKGISPWHFSNEMYGLMLLNALYLLVVFLLFGLGGVLIASCIAFLGVVLLESINYLEHYGLRRKKLASGRYEKVDLHHSWNSSHPLGRIFLYELTRHPDHHYKTTRPYQNLRHSDKAPQLPFGYPASMLMSLIPPLWFHVMDAQLDKLELN